MCKLRKICQSRGVVGFQRGRFDKLTRGEGKNSGGLRPPLELCFGTSEIECSASWSYISTHPDLIIKLLVSVIQ